MDANRTELVLGNLAGRVERRVGQEVGGRFHVAEGHEHRAPGHAVVPACERGDPAPARLEKQPVARLHAEPLQLEEVEAGRGDRLQLVEHLGAAGQGAGMPLLEEPAGEKDERVLLVGELGRRRETDGHQPGTPGRRRERVREEDLGARVAFQQTGRGDRVLASQPFPGDARVAGHGTADLLEDVRGPGVGPAAPQAVGNLLEDPPVLPRSAGGLERLPAELDPAVGVRKGAGLLGAGRGGEDHIREGGGLGQEDFLGDQPFECGQRLAHHAGVRVRHRRVLPHQIHPPDLVPERGLHHLHHRQPGRTAQRVVPERLEVPPGIGVVHPPISWKERGEEPHVGGALDVVLATERVEPGASAADVPREQRQVHEAPGVVGAMDVLRDSHAPEDQGVLCPGVQPGGLPDQRGGEPADRFHDLRAKALQVPAKLLESLGARREERRVGQPLLDDDVHHRVQDGDVGAGPELQEMRREPRQLGPSHIDDDQTGPPLHRVLEEGGRDRVIDRGVRPHHHRHIGVSHVGDGVGARPGTQHLQHRGQGGGMAEAGAVVHVVGAEAGADELLQQVRLLVASLGGAQGG